MTGAPFWDAAIWVVLGLIGGVVLGRWGTPRAPFVFAVVIALAGAVAVPVIFIWQGAEGIALAVMVMLWSIPTTIGLALGALVARIWRRD
ncbi:hypothetical protein [Pararhodobacter oceanensis]|uniref:hypothetical protein n=1 Tax=Pararhodobacter oceanensis TaxID=2172121 RepID=UPI003A8F285B